jgi:hypothetical protein
LPRRREVDQLTIAVEKQLACVGAQSLVERQALDLKMPFGVAKCLAKILERDSMLGSQRTKNVRLDEIPER